MERIAVYQEKEKQRRMELQNKKKELEKKELAECSFRPDLTVNRQINEYALKSFYGGNDVITRLYKPVHNEQVKEIQQQFSRYKDELEMSECTFKPQINHRNSTSQRDSLQRSEVKGFDKIVERQQKARNQNLQKTEKLTKIPAGENYHKNRNQEFKPPSMLSRQPKKRIPYYQNIVNLEGGR